ncbi:MAG: LEVG family PEP-CTERM protein [Heteroscytonema crispum UTEX LB 1556]
MTKLNIVAKLLTVSTLGFGLVGGMQNAQAINLVPQKEGEIKTNLACIASRCIDTSSELGYTVTSLSYSNSSNSNTYAPSRLFVDDRKTGNNWGFGINFGTTDAGTNPAKDQYWFRPVALDKNGNAVENGQLEVGRFKFDFGKIFSEVTLNLFDVEDTLKTGIFEINGNPVQQLVASAGLADNGTTKFITLKNVSSFVIQAGYRGSDSVFPKTGDGVAIQATAVPEPTVTASLGALAVVGMLGLRKRKQVSPTA